MYTLLLDCSDINLSVGISLKDNLLYKKSFYAWQRQSEYMIPEIKKALEQINISINDISVVALGIGPGSYTGIRIPLTISKTLSILNNVKIIPLSSLQIMGKSDEKYIALMNARSDRSYIGIYDNGRTVLADQVIENNKLNDLIEKYLNEGFVLKGNIDYLKLDYQVDMDVIEGLLSYSLITKATVTPEGLTPVYLKDNYGNK